MANTTIRLATAEDHRLLLPLVIAFRDHLRLVSPSETEVSSSLERLLVDPDTDFIVALSGEADAVGYAQVRYRHSLWVAGLEGQLDDLFVAPSARCVGVGAALLEATVGQARKRGCRVIGLNTNERNVEALRLYTRTGFSAARERWDGALQLWLELAIGGEA